MGTRRQMAERYDMHQLTAAHRTLPLGSIAVVRSMSTGRQVTVRINDRGPFARGGVLDLSLAGAHALGMTGAGTDQIELRVVGYQGRTVNMGSYECKSGPFPISRMHSTSWSVRNISTQAAESRLSICQKVSDIEFRLVNFPGSPGRSCRLSPRIVPWAPGLCISRRLIIISAGFIQPAFPILQFFCGHATQLFDIVACLQHMLARHSVLWYIYSPMDTGQISPLSSHSVLPNLTIAG